MYEQVSISDIADVVTGKTPSTKDSRLWEPDIPFITPKDLQATKHIATTDRRVSNAVKDRCSKQVVPAGSVCVSCIGNLGYVGVTEVTSLTNQQINTIVPNDPCDSDYLYYVMRWLWPYFKHLEGQSTTLSIINKSQFKRTSIPWPNQRLRQRISDILNCFDDMIELNLRTNDYLLEMAKAIFKHWFVDEDALYPTKMMKMQDVATINAGGDKPASVTPTIQAGSDVPIFSNGIDNEGLYGFTSKAKITDPSVTVSARGTIGYTCLRRRPYYPIVRLLSATPKQGITAEYLYLWLLSTAIVGVGTTQQQLTVPMFKLYEVGVPTAEAMKRFSTIVNPLFDTIDSNKEECIKLAALRDALLPKLMSGEIKVQRMAIECGLSH